MTIKWEKTALIVIDVQVGLFRMKRPIYKAEELLENINKVTDKARKAGIPVIYVQHANKSKLAKETEGYNIHPSLKPQKEDPRYHKTVGSAFEETSLHEDLQKKGIETLVITGLMTNACINKNSRAAKKLGYKVILVSDGHSRDAKEEKQGK
ncbi:MAG: cysteine hydrolase, partial [Asgard group archaeon]|nr:cysteine hydrolase [Asgard group archaeon]